MRWLVEVTSLGRTEKDSLYVDAESWQKALQVARTLRGETEPMSGFSIELLDEGCRAVDPATRIAYEVHRAPEDARPPTSRPSAVPPRPAAAAEPATPLAALFAQPVASPSVQPVAAPVPTSVQPTLPPASLSIPESPPRVRSQFPPRPQISANATMMLGNPPSGGSVAPSVSVSGGAPESAKGSHEPRAARSDPDARSGSMGPPASRGDAATTLP